MNITLHKNDLPDNISFEGSVAVDSETLGLRPERDSVMSCSTIIWRWKCTLSST